MVKDRVVRLGRRVFTAGQSDIRQRALDLARVAACEADFERRCSIDGGHHAD
jgi:hypothetical protein